MNLVLADEVGGAKAEERREDVEEADDDHRHDDRFARLPCRRNGVEADEDMRKACRSEHEGDVQGQVFPRVGEVFAGFQEVLPEFVGQRVPEGNRIEGKFLQHEDGQKGGSGHQQDGFDDLHPRGGQHAAERDVQRHEHADDDDGQLVVEAEKQLDEAAGAHQLGDHVEGADRQRAQGGHRANRFFAQAKGEHVGQRVLPGVAQRFGHDEQHKQVRDKKAEGVDEPVVAV